MTDLLLPRVNLARLNDHVLEKMVSCFIVDEKLRSAGLESGLD